MSWKSLGSFLFGALLLFSTASTALCQEEPRSERAAVRAGTPTRQIGGHRSSSLGATFIAEWMYIDYGGQRVEFWGARITSLENWSPLHNLGLRNGDVITRLDGVRISRSMHKLPGASEWTIPELDRHYGRTEVRYIVTGTSDVRLGDVMLGNLGGGGGVAVPP